MTDSTATNERCRATPGRAGVAALVLLGLVLGGCLRDEPVLPPPTAVCFEGELRVDGTIAGQTVAVRHLEQGHSFVNKLGSRNGMLDVTTDRGALSLEFDELVPDGGSSTALGWFQDDDLGLDVGNCEAAGFVSTLWIDDDGNGGSFVLGDLHRAPYCGGEAVTGELAGCFRYRAF